MSAGPVALAGTVTVATEPLGIIVVLKSPFTVMVVGVVVLPVERLAVSRTVVPDGTITVAPLAARVMDCPGKSVIDGSTWRVRVCEAVVMVVDESETVTVKVLVPTPAAVGVPEISPAVLKDKPSGRLPLVRVQL